MSTDLRDGNQSLIEPMSIERKLRFFEQLVKIGFEEIESRLSVCLADQDFDFVRKLIDETRIPDDVAIIVLTAVARSASSPHGRSRCAGAAGRSCICTTPSRRPSARSCST